MTIAQLKSQLYWLLDQLAAVHEAYAASGTEAAVVNGVTQGEKMWRLNDRIASTRVALRCREEIAAATAPVTP